MNFFGKETIDLIKEKNIVGTRSGETNPDKDIPRYGEWNLSGKLKLEKLITHKYKLEDINQFFDYLDEGKVGRAVINMISLSA